MLGFRYIPTKKPPLWAALSGLLPCNDTSECDTRQNGSCLEPLVRLPTSLALPTCCSREAGAHDRQQLRQTTQEAAFEDLAGSHLLFELRVNEALTLEAT